METQRSGAELVGVNSLETKACHEALRVKSINLGAFCEPSRVILPRRMEQTLHPLELRDLHKIITRHQGTHT